MPTICLAVVYYSTYGTDHQMGEIAAEAARGAGAVVRLLEAPETVPAGIVNGQDAWRAQAERSAHVPAATMADLERANAHPFSLAPPGYTDPATHGAGGNPYGVTVTADGQGIPDAVKEGIRHQARRLVEFAAKIAA